MTGFAAVSFELEGLSRTRVLSSLPTSRSAIPRRRAVAGVPAVQDYPASIGETRAGAGLSDTLSLSRAVEHPRIGRA